MTPTDQPPATPARGPVDPTTAHPARRYNYWLGGKDHFAADRASADRIAQALPTIALAARENRRLLQRVVGYLAAHAGIHQYLDIGVGLPTSPTVHDIAQAVTPTARVVSVDNDPLVIAHARARLPTADGRSAVVHADLRHPHTILTDPALHTTLDLDQPVGLLLLAVLHFLPDPDDPVQAVAHLLDSLAPGSYLAISHATLDPLPAASAHHLAALAAPDAGHGPFQFRSHREISRFLHGLDLLDPGLVPVVAWRPGDPPHPQATAEQTAGYAAVARVP
ncbi:MAG: SAM-dependent methyltransferase [Dactylosporangium sp.]|nr:SAM-dependent methyltransferase [Dactylosporangium sp.]NNJ61923.1 SAM-dependent methyltransferase [Dactylosporangium sp.]